MGMAGFSAAVLGIIVLCHSWQVKKLEARAIKKLQSTEELLEIAAGERAEDSDWEHLHGDVGYGIRRSRVFFHLLEILVFAACGDGDSEESIAKPHNAA